MNSSTGTEGSTATPLGVNVSIASGEGSLPPDASPSSAPALNADSINTTASVEGPSNTHQGFFFCFVLVLCSSGAVPLSYWPLALSTLCDTVSTVLAKAWLSGWGSPCKNN